MAKMRIPSVVAILLLLTCLPVTAAGSLESDLRQIDVGDFLVRLASAHGLPASDASSAESHLREAGWALPALDLDAPLTEGAVVAIIGANGFPVRTSSPGAILDESRVTDLLRLLGQNSPEPQASEDGESAGGPDPWDHGADPRTKGKGKKKGLLKSPSSPV